MGIFHSLGRFFFPEKEKTPQLPARPATAEEFLTRIHEFELLSGVKLHREWNNDHEEVYYFSDQRKILVDKWPEKLTEDEWNEAMYRR